MPLFGCQPERLTVKQFVERRERNGFRYPSQPVVLTDFTLGWKLFSSGCTFPGYLLQLERTHKCFSFEYGLAEGKVAAMMSKDDRNFLDNEEFVSKVPVALSALLDRIARTLALPATASAFKTVIQQPVSEGTKGKEKGALSLQEEAEEEDVDEWDEAEDDGEEVESLTGETAYKRLYWRSKIPAALFQDIQPFHEEEFLRSPSSSTTTDTSSSSSRRFRQDLMRMWVSTEGCVTPLHYDRCHGLLVQVEGLKQVTLFSPEETRNVYPNSALHPSAHASRLRLHALLFEGDANESLSKKGKELDYPAKFPRFYERFLQDEARDATDERTAFNVMLSPGEVLYTPPGWWHHVTTMQQGSVSITIPWDMLSSETVPVNMR
ncbi:JmjC domain-containing protein [Balamuthia mandrillaris]